MSIECIQDAVVYKLSRKDMNTLCKKIPSIETFLEIKWKKHLPVFKKEF